MDNFITCLYVHSFCFCKAPKTYYKYLIYCNMHGTQISTILLRKIIYINHIKNNNFK